jgi:hypothetical protein
VKALRFCGFFCAWWSVIFAGVLRKTDARTWCFCGQFVVKRWITWTVDNTFSGGENFAAISTLFIHSRQPKKLRAEETAAKEGLASKFGW